MLTYNRGQWVEDISYPDDWTIKNSSLEYADFESMADFVIGENHYVEINVFSSKDPHAKYRFFVIISSPLSTFGDVLVADFPSLLMLIKDASPMIEMSREQEKLDMQEEEHEWKAKDLESYQYRKECQHI